MYADRLLLCMIATCNFHKYSFRRFDNGRTGSINNLLKRNPDRRAGTYGMLTIRISEICDDVLVVIYGGWCLTNCSHCTQVLTPVDKYGCV